MMRWSRGAAREEFRARWNAFVGTLPLVLRRMRADMVPLMGITMLVAVAASIAVSVPRAIESTLDRAASELVASAGSDADLILSAPVGGSSVMGATTADRLTRFTSELGDRLPHSIVKVSDGVAVGILSPPLVGTTERGEVNVQIGVLDSDARETIEPVSGVIPDTDAVAQNDTTPVVLSTESARASALQVGDSLTLGGVSPDDPVHLVVAAIVDRVGVSERFWKDLPHVWNPQEPESPSENVAFTVLTGALAFDSVTSRFPDVASGQIRVSFDAARFDADRLARIQDSIDVLETSTESIAGGAPLSVLATSGLEDAAQDFPAAAGAASARLSALGAGVFSVSVLLLVRGFVALSSRREREIEILRSRGASPGLVVLHAGGEAIGVVSIGVALGGGLTVAVTGAPNTPALLVLAIVVAPLAAIAVVVRQVITVPETSRVFRVAAVAIVATVAVLALLALRSRDRGSWGAVDPLAFAAPVLCAAVVAILLSPLPVVLTRPVRAAVARSRGAGSLVAITGTGHSISVLTLTTLTLAASVAMTSLVLGGSTVAAQEDNAWQQVGADLRLDDVADPDAALAAFESKNIAAAAVTVIDRAGLQGKHYSLAVTVLAVDERYPDLLAALPEGHPARGNVSAVERLVEESRTSSTENGSVPVLLDARRGTALSDSTLSLEFDDVSIPLRAVNSAIVAPGFPAGPVAVVDQTAVASYLADQNAEPAPPVYATSILAVGPGAAAVTVDGFVGKRVERQAVLERERSGALASGLANTTRLSLVGAAALAMIGLLLVTVFGARRRGRTLALLGALGVPRRAGVAAAIGELAPVVVGAVIGGALASAVVLAVAGEAFGLGPRGDSGIDVVVAGTDVLGVVGVALIVLVLAVLVDAPLSRRTRATTILRSGEES